jgi:hypothetical protein
MSTLHHIQTNFTAGELSPQGRGRIDFAKYFNGADTLKNVIVHPWGGAKRRGGFRYVASTKYPLKKARMIPFEFSAIQAYELEFGHQYVRFFANNEQVKVSNGSELVANGTFDSDLTGWTDVSTGGSSVSWDSGHAKFNWVSEIAALEQAIATTVGKTYRITFNVNAVKISLSTNSGLGDVLAPRWFESGVYTIEFVAQSEFTYVRFFTTQASYGGGTLDDVSCFEYIPYEIVSPYNETDLDQIGYTQSADVLYLVHPNYAPRKLMRYSSMSWAFETMVFDPPATWEADTDLNTTLTPGATTGDDVVFTAGASVFLAADLDRQIKYGSARAVINEVTDGSHVKADILDAFPDTNPIPAGSWFLMGSPIATCTPSKKSPKGARVTLTLDINGWRTEDVGKYVKIYGGTVKIVKRTSALIAKGIIKVNLREAANPPVGTTNWTLEVTDWTATRGYPTATCFFEDRLFFVNTISRPQSMWATRPGDYQCLGMGVLDSHGLEFTINSNEVNAIQWIIPARVLMAGTTGGELRVTGGADNPLTPTNVDVKSETTYGSANVKPIRVGPVILFVQRSGTKLRELVYSFDYDSYVAPDLGLLVDHLLNIPDSVYPNLDVRIKAVAYQQEPFSVLWVLMSNGRLYSMTYERAHEVIAWTWHETNGMVESVSVIPNPNKRRDDVWIEVCRTVGGGPVRFIEYADPDMNTDAGLTGQIQSGDEKSTVWSGLSHIAGKTVNIVGDDAVFPNQEVSATGQVTISEPVSKIEVGLEYDSKVKTLPPEVQLQSGTSQGRKKKWNKIYARLYQSAGCSINGETVPVRKASDPMGVGTGLFTGDFPISCIGWDEYGQVTVEQNYPRPMNLLAIFGDLNVSD